jgi:phospholipid/cholesterol/gamma-HCH transport system substrate-binding protein
MKLSKPVLTKGVFTKGMVALAVAGVVAGTTVAVSDSDSGDVGLTAMFPDASPIIAGNLVRANGIQVGEVESVSLDHGQGAVRMKLDPGILPLHNDASVKIRPVTLLGERFVELNPGTPSAPLMSSNEVIPAERTSRSVDLDEVLNSVDDPASASLAALATTLGEGVGGQGDKADAALTALAPAMQNTQQLGDILNQQNEVLNRLLDKASPVAEAAAGKDGDQLGQAVDAAKQMLHAVATQREALQDAVKQLPDTLTKAQQTLSQVAGAAESGTPALRAARPVTDNLPQITNELNAFADSANPALASLPPVLDKAKALLDQARPAVHDLRPGADALPGISESANRLVGRLTPMMSTVLDFIKQWAMSTNGRDALGNYFRAFVVTTPKSLLQIPGVGLGPSKDSGGQPAPAPPGLPGLPAPGGPLPLPLPGAPALGDGNSATGLNQQQEGSLLDQLLGGGN